MPIRMSTVKALCTKDEIALVLDSTATRITKLSEADLRRDITRARRLRDKYDDLAKRQRREARGKQAPRARNASQSNENTLLKRDIFAEVLGKFEAKLAKLENREGKRPTKALPRTRPKAERKTKKKSAASAKSEDGRGSGNGKAPGKTPAKAPATPTPRAAAGGNGKAAGLLNGMSKGPKRKGSARGLLAAGSATGIRSNPALKSRSDATSAVRSRDTQKRSNRPAIQGHLKARTRRNQAKRDAR